MATVLGDSSKPMSTLQLIIDTIGKLGPFSVAGAVLLVSLRQNRWSNRLAARAAAVEDQKFRLALIERRITAVDALRTANAEFGATGKVTDEVFKPLVDALRVAELVFDEADQEAIEGVLQDAIRWSVHERAVQSFQDRDAARMVDALQKQDQITGRLLDSLPNLQKQLLLSARIRVVPPIVR